MRRGWQRAFTISICIFITTFIFAIVAIFTNVFIPDDIFYSPAYTSPIGVEPVIGFIKAIDTADFYATILSGIASGFTFLMKAMRQLPSHHG